MLGAARMLQEGGFQFDVVDSESDFSSYKVLVLPDSIPISDALSKKIQDYLDGGGAAIASFESGLNEGKEGFAVDALGVKFKGLAPFSPDFILAKEAMGEGLNETEYVMYERGLEIEALPGSTVLADSIIPYFNRTFQHFCSHSHTPSAGKRANPAVIQNGNTIYFSHPIFSGYNASAPRWYKQLLFNALGRLLPNPVVVTDGPSTLIVMLNEQKEDNRRIVHLLHYVPERRSQEIDTIEDVIPLCNVRVSLRSDHDYRTAVCVPSGTPLELEPKDGRVEFVVPEIRGHQMVEVGY